MLGTLGLGSALAALHRQGQHLRGHAGVLELSMAVAVAVGVCLPGAHSRTYKTWAGAAALAAYPLAVVLLGLVASSQSVDNDRP